jgi:hypothetical protein
MFLTKPLYKSFSSLKKLILLKDWPGTISFLESNPSEVQKSDLDDLMTSFYKEKRYIEAFQLLHLLPFQSQLPGEWEYTMALETSIESEKFHQSLNIFYQTQVFGIPLDSIVYDKLLSICSKDSGSSNIKTILFCMMKDNSIASGQTLMSVLKLATTMKDYGLVEMVLNAMKAAGYSIPKKVIAPFISKTQSDSSEYKALSSYWKSIQKYVTDQDKDVEMEKEGKKGKDSYSFGVFVMPNEKDLAIKEEDTSTDESSD